MPYYTGTGVTGAMHSALGEYSSHGRMGYCEERPASRLPVVMHGYRHEAWNDGVTQSPILERA